jgi:hypothetical protein
MLMNLKWVPVPAMSSRKSRLGIGPRHSKSSAVGPSGRLGRLMIEELSSLSAPAPSAQQGFPQPKNEFIIAPA